MTGSDGGAPIDRAWTAIRSRLTRVRPARLAWGAGAVAALAILLFAWMPGLVGPALLESGQRAPPEWLGSAHLDSQGVYDRDADGLADALENQVYGTDPLAGDSAGAGIPDGWLVQFGYNPLDPAIATHPAARPPLDALPAAYRGAWPTAFAATLHDIYAHGRPPDWNESAQGPHRNGLDPTRWDANDDGIPDGWLLHHGLDPLDQGIGAAHLAGPQGLSVREAFLHGTDPRRADSDGDGLADREELAGPENPTPQGPRRFPPTDPARADTAGAGVCDGYLAAHGLDPTQASLARGDPDGDGATTLEEFGWSHARFGPAACAQGQGLDPARQRTGGSAIPDGWLLRHGLDPLGEGVDARVTQSSRTDPGPAEPGAGAEVTLTVLQEYRVNRPSDWDEAGAGPWWGGTDPGRNDTDGDGLGDAWELRGFQLAVATDPGNPAGASYPATSDPARQDTDGDGLADGAEADPTQRAGGAGGRTDPRRWDTDFDGLDDGREVGLGLGLDPARADTAGDLLRDGERLDLLRARAAAYAEGLEYAFPGEPGRTRSVLDWILAMPGAGGAGAASVPELVGPEGNLDGDRDAQGQPLPNVRDPDIDGDGLLNGWETRPQAYAGTEFGAGEFTDGRPATDPLNPDTDGDLLPDGWELRHGQPIFDVRVQRYSLDPSRWNSDAEAEAEGEQESDAAEDPDGDGARWFAFRDGAAVPNGGRFTNLEEMQYEELGADPNRFDSDGDRLADGWKVFWGLVYPGLGPQSTPSPGEVYPGAPGPLSVAALSRPQLGQAQADVVIREAPYTRFTGRADQLLPGEAAAEASGVYRVQGVVRYRFSDAHANGTNPYLADTDGDGMPDWWETLHARALPGMSRPNGEPVGGCVAGDGPSPVAPDGGVDLDGDGLRNLQEHQRGTDPLCADSDLSGIGDGQELGFQLNPADPADDRTLLEDGADSDGDGLLDFEEVTGITSVDYRYLGPLPVRTRFDHPDTDGDGLLDGATRPDPQETPQGWAATDPLAARFLDLGVAYSKTPQGRFFFLGEKDSGNDPREGDDSGTGVPAGWLEAHGVPPGGVTADHVELYRIAMPSWWDPALHGPWWGGGGHVEDLPGLRGKADLDQDGLRDADGEAGHEDPFPGANRPNQPRAVDYAAHGLTAPAGPRDPDAGPLALRMAAQALLAPRDLGDSFYAYLRGSGHGETTPRTQPCLTLDSTGPLALEKGGAAAPVTGAVTHCGGAPIAGVTVEARLGFPATVVGAGFTDLNGRFSIPVHLVAQQQVGMPPAAVAFRGNASGLVQWESALGAIPPGPGTLVVRTYATPAGPAYATRVPPLFAASQAVPVTVHAGSLLNVTAPSPVLTGPAVPVAVRLTDATGAPLEAVVEVGWEGSPPAQATTGPDGTATVPLPAPHGLAGQRKVVASFIPSGLSSDYVGSAQAQVSVLLQRPGSLSLQPPGVADAGAQVQVRGLLRVAAGDAGGVPVVAQVAQGGSTPVSGTATTAPDGRFAIPILLPTTAGAGAHVVTVSVAPGAPAVAGPVQDTLAVRGIPRFVAVQDSNLTAGRPAPIAARLVEPDGLTPIAQAPVALHLGGWSGTATTDADGRFAVEADATLPVRPALQRLVFAGDATHQPGEHRLQRLVASPTRLELADGTVGRGLDAAVQVRLLDGEGRPLPGAPITLRWGDEPAHTALTQPDGRATWVRRAAPGDALGPVAVRAAYPGNPPAGLAASAAQTVWRLQSAADLALPNGTFQVGTPVPPGVLRDGATRTPLADAPLALRAGSHSWSVRTDERGRFSVLPPGGDGPGRLALTATYPGGDGYAPATNTSVVDRRIPVTLAVQAPAVIVAGREAVLVATLDPAAGGEVVLHVGATRLGQWPARAGTAHLNLTLPPRFPPGTAELHASYLGDDLHSPAAWSGTVAVRAPVELRLQAERVRPGSVATVRVVALSGGEPLPFMPLSLAVGGIPSGLAATTDKDGVATFLLEQDTSIIPVAARYAGDDLSGPAIAFLSLEPASAFAAVGQAGFPVATAALAAALLLAVAAFVATRLRRQPLEEAFRRIHHLLEARGLSERTILAAYRILEDAAIAKALLLGKAATPRVLEEGLRPALPPAAHGSLGRFIALFEEARYGPGRLGEGARATAVQALQDILRRLPSTPFAAAPAGRPA